MHLGWSQLACMVSCFALGIALEELISKLVFLLAEFVSMRLLGASLVEDLEEEFVWVVGPPILGLVVNLCIRGYRACQL